MAKTSGDRIVVLIDMDCFFCQVETKRQPEYAGKPLAVVQYNQWKLGGIIAVNYEAREHGVTRHMRGDEAKEKCPDLVLASVPCLRGKSDTSRYRVAGREVVEVISKHCSIVERASVDEAYLDITDIVDKKMSSSTICTKELKSQLLNTFVVGYSEIGKNDEDDRSKGVDTWLSNVFEELEDLQAQKLALAGVIVEELRHDIFEKTGYRCSAGIAQNKILAKLACGLHKPNRQTILPPAAVPALYATLPVKKVRNLGGKFGDVVVESLNCNVMGDLLRYSLQYLQKRFDDKTGLWLYNIARGVDNEPVTTRLVSKSIGACKKFPGKQAIVSLDVLKHWAGELAAEVCERLEQDLEENERRATLLTICYHYYQNRTTVSQSRSCTLTSYKPEKMADRCVDIIRKSTQCPVAFLGISVGKFVQAKGSDNFRNFFKSGKIQDNGKTTYETEYNKIDLGHALTDIDATDMTDTNGIKTDAVDTSIPVSTTAVKSVSTSLSRTDIKLVSTAVLTTNSDAVSSCAMSDSVESREIHKTSNNIESRETPNVECKAETKKKDRVRDAKAHASVKERITNSSTSKMGDSPTSRRVNNLIKSLNERKKETVLYKAAINTCELNESLDQAKFKGSFFMNVFNGKEERAKSEVQEANVYKFNDHEDIESGYESKDSDESNVERSTSENDCDLFKEELQSDGRQTDHVEKNNVPAMPRTVSSTRYRSSNEMHPNGVQYDDAKPSTSYAASNKNTDDIITEQKIFPHSMDSQGDKPSSVRLQEIFPDLDNIDPSILLLLPPDLQAEAKQYMKARNKSTVKTTETTIKGSKAKSNKSKTNNLKGKKENNMYTFLIKGTDKMSNTSDVPLERCLQCNQMIPISKYNEHNDFHVAQNLQRELNALEPTTGGVKRKIVLETEENAIKRRPDADTCKSDRSTRSIATFFT